jgi:hypothetical protein
MGYSFFDESVYSAVGIVAALCRFFSSFCVAYEVREAFFGAILTDGAIFADLTIFAKITI